MLFMRTLIFSFTLGTSLSACFQLPTQSVGQVTVLDGSARSVASKEVSEGKASATIDPDAKSPQLLAAPSSGKLSGSSITIQPGSLALSSELLIEEAVSLGETSLVSELRLTDDLSVQNVGAGLIIRPSQGVDLSQPLTINMPLPVASGLRLQSSQNVVIFYKQFVGESMISGLIPGNKVLLKGDGSVSFEGYFGAYWVALMNKPIIEEVKTKSEEPIVNSQRVSVIQSTGVVSEATVLTKASIPPVSWKSVELSLEADTRIVYLKASLASGSLTACKADLFLSPTDSRGLVFEISTTPQLRYVVTKAEAHALLGRFRCQDDQGRVTTSPWSPVIQIPALRIVAPPVSWAAVDLSLDTATRIFSLAAKTINNRTLKECVAIFQPKSAEALPTSVETGAMLSASYEHSVPIGETFRAQFKCRDEEGRLSESPWSIAITVANKVITQPSAVEGGVSLPAGGGIGSSNPSGAGASTAIMNWNQTSLILNADRSLNLQAFPSSTTNFQSCHAEFAQDPNAIDPHTIDSGTSMLASYSPLVSNQHPLYGRIVCQLKSGGMTASPWSEPVTVPASGPAYCSISAPSLAAYGSLGTVMPMFFDYFKHTEGTCAYEMDIFVDRNANFLFRNEDSNLICGSTAHPLASNSPSILISCQAGNLSNFNSHYISLARGNYRARLNFSANPQTPVLELNKIPCPSGDLFLRSSTSASFSPVTGADAMTHLGACEFEKELNFGSLSTGSMRISDLSETRFCNTSSSLNDALSYSNFGTCSSTANSTSFYNLTGNYKVHVRSGISADPSGFNPNSFIIRGSSEQICPDNFYLLGEGVGTVPLLSNKFVSRGIEAGNCLYSYDWISGNAGSISAFDLTVGNDSGLVCGVYENNTLPGVYSDDRTLTCTPSSVAIRSDLIQAQRPYSVELQVSPYGATPNSLSIIDGRPKCRDSIFFQPNAQNGIFLGGSRMMHQLEECLYEYEWTPTSNTPFHLVASDEGNLNICGLSAGAPQIQVGSPLGIYLSCNDKSSSAAQPILPFGITLGTKYKVQLDYRLSSFDNPPLLRVFADSSPLPCTDDFYLTGGSFGSTASATNKFQRVSGCNFELIHRPNTYSPGNLQVLWSDSTSPSVSCGNSAVSISTNKNYSLDCSGGSNFLSNVYFSSNSTYRMSITKRGSEKIFAIDRLEVSCNPDAVYIAGSAATGLAIKNFNLMGECNYEFTWNPSSAQPFFIKNGDSYCGATEAAGLQPNNTFQSAICNIKSTANISPFSPSVTSGQSYRITLDLSRPELLPRIKMESLGTISASSLEFLSGSTNANASGTIGTLEVPDSANTPSARAHAARWADANGNLWLFGGLGSGGTLSDFWTYNTASRQWTIYGFGSPNGSFGSVGSSNSTNYPSARWGATTWISSNRLWLFGGHGYDQGGSDEGKLSDLWSYDLSSKLWTWEAGNQLKDFVGNYSGGVLEPRSRAGGASWVGSDERLWLYGGDSSSGYLSDLWVYDPGLDSWECMGGSGEVNLAPSGNPGSLAFGSTWTRAGNEFWLFGGSVGTNSYQTGLWKYQVGANTWTNMNNSSGPSNYGTLGVASSSNYPSARDMAGSWTDAVGNLWLIGGHGIDLFSNDSLLTDVWVYSPSSNQWSWVGGSDITNSFSIYGSSTNSLIGSRRGASVWHVSGNTYVFGGSGKSSAASTPSLGFLNDLWRLNTTSP